MRFFHAKQISISSRAAQAMRQLALDIGLPVGPTLENYLPGGNSQVVQHLDGIVQAHDQRGAPVYLWGGQGTGKSHLLKAAVTALNGQGARAGWLDASVRWPCAFDEGWNAIALDEVERYNPAQQAAAFNWFVNASSPATGTPRHILAAGSLPPADLPLREDLRTRLGWGHVFRLEPLDEAQCRAALQRQAGERGVVLTDEVTRFMLVRFARDMGSLMRLLERLDQFALQERRAITIPLLRAMLQDGPHTPERA